ncbi:hypothetical protein [Microvirus mar4]|uniref:Uncharacterized protein n=1 Tax=Microvirus mar4 TaxID=2851174 RepID=A0A8F5MK15_9VIRU|nr:hypothetical protein [Microvirus mar4]
MFSRLLTPVLLALDSLYVAVDAIVKIVRSFGG